MLASAVLNARRPYWPVFNARLRWPFGRWSLARQFLVANLVLLVAGTLVVGAWMSDQIRQSVLDRTSAMTALYVESIVEPHIQPMRDRPWLAAEEVAALDDILTATPLGERIVAFKVWSPDGTVVYSPNRVLIGRTFEGQDDLAEALEGKVVADLSDLSRPENVFEREFSRQLMEVYVPVRERGGPRVIAVTEFYQPVDELEGEAQAARIRLWVGLAGAALVSYLLLAGLVKRGSDTIARQQASLREKVSSLSRLLSQNARLHERVRHAAEQTTALNEQALRRISADLHDGPGQALALVLLRLDYLHEQIAAAGVEGRDEFGIVHGAVREALEEIRAISSGLRAPDLAPLTTTAVAARVVREHERRSQTSVSLQTEDVPDEAPLAVKIALFRTLQEALSNATRHGQGVGVTAKVQRDACRLCLAVSDSGPGFPVETLGSAQGLGLAGMRERAELLGGSFEIESRPGAGTTVKAWWPLVERADV